MPEQRYSSRSGPKNSDTRTGLFADLFNDQAWQSRGSCAQPGADPKWWFPTRGSGEADNTSIAKRICSTCPVKPECLVYITENPQYGTWSGYTEAERRELGIGKKLP